MSHYTSEVSSDDDVSRLFQSRASLSRTQSVLLTLNIPKYTQTTMHSHSHPKIGKNRTPTSPVINMKSPALFKRDSLASVEGIDSGINTRLDWYINSF